MKALNLILLNILRVSFVLSILFLLSSISETINRSKDGMEFLYWIIFDIVIAGITVLQFYKLKKLSKERKDDLNYAKENEKTPESNYERLLYTRAEKVNPIIKAWDYFLIVFFALLMIGALILLGKSLLNLILDEKTAISIIMNLILTGIMAFLAKMFYNLFKYFRFKYKTKYVFTEAEKEKMRLTINNRISKEELEEKFGTEGDLSLTIGGYAYTSKLKDSGNRCADEFEMKFCKWIEEKTGSKAISYAGTNAYYWEIESDDKKAEFLIIANDKNTTMEVDSKWILRIDEREPFILPIIEKEFIDKKRIIRKIEPGKNKNNVNRIQFKAEELKEDSELNI